MGDLTKLMIRRRGKKSKCYRAGNKGIFRAFQKMGGGIGNETSYLFDYDSEYKYTSKL
jgi:hypothetical protein